MTKSKNFRKAIWVILTVIIFLTLACFLYVSDYYPADTGAIDAFSADVSVSGQVPQEGMIVYAPEEAEAGLIFYPGGKVEYTAYEPLMMACAEKGILCILLEMPGNLAVLNPNAADGVIEQYPEIESWYIGGHSLGGSMAANYAAKHSSELDGLILLAAYSTSDLKDTSLKVLSVYGGEDRVLNAEKYAENKKNLPEDFTEVIINGGCHAGFGMYGTQDGDGVPELSSEEQIQIASEEIYRFVETIH